MAVFGAFSLFRAFGWYDAIGLGLVLQADWWERGGFQWVALLANGFVSFSLLGLGAAIVVVLICLPWLERRMGSLPAASIVVALAVLLGPIKIALGGTGAVGASKFIPMLRTFWMADNPLLLWGSTLLGRGGAAAQAASMVVRRIGWIPAVWLGWDHLVGGNPAHTLSVAAGLVLAAFQLRRPWVADESRSDTTLQDTAPAT